MTLARRVKAPGQAPGWPRANCQKRCGLSSLQAIGQSGAERGFVRNYGIAHEAQLIERPLTRFAMAGSAGIHDNDGHDAEIDCVPN